MEGLDRLGAPEAPPEERAGARTLPAKLRSRLSVSPVPRALPARTEGLGALWDGSGTTFAVMSEHAEGMNLVLLDPDGSQREFRLERRGNVWSGYVAGVGPSQRYGYRAIGPSTPSVRSRFDPTKVLLDPHARAVEEGAGVRGGTVWGVIADPAFDWEGDTRPQPQLGGLTYELHVKGFTKTLSSVPAQLRGTYLGLAHPSVGQHLRSLGVRCVELMPVHRFLDQPGVEDLGLTNYWGYDPINWFAPENRYAVSHDPIDVVREFKTMVRELHRQGLEVIIDVVFNHTAEGGSGGPTLSLRGLDDSTYYRLATGNPAAYIDMTGCGNTVDLSQPETLALVVQSLRYWVTEMHVDGFRFDEAPVLGRDGQGRFSPSATFFAALHADPVLSHVRLVAEPWDASSDGLQQGNFPVDWAEWNGRYRDDVRDFWSGRARGVGNFATRLAGSSDLFAANHRSPQHSVNYISVHDGLTLKDVVSYERKHNEANGENNRDGANDNHSWNNGIEGDTLDPAINALRSRQQRNLLATLFLSQGTPLLLQGDEMGRTQRGNNNPYNQDNATYSWVDWAGRDAELLTFTQRLAALRETHPVLQRSAFLEGQTGLGPQDRDCVWLRPDGQVMQPGDFNDSARRSVGLLLNGDQTGMRHPDGTEIHDDTLILLFNASPTDQPWQLPADWGTSGWEVLLDTADERNLDSVASGGSVTLRGPAVMVLRRR